jgi:PDZ domain-containing protein
MPRDFCRSQTVLRFTAISMCCALVAGAARVGRTADSLSQDGATPLTGEFQIGKDGRLILVPVALGPRMVSCLVDTGACLSAFDVTLKEFLGPPRGMRKVQTADRPIRVETYDWPDARLDGRVVKSGQATACLDLRHIQEATNEPVLGVIGIDLLKVVCFQVDFDEGVLRFLPSLPEAPGDLGVKIPVRFRPDGLPVIAGLPGTHDREDFVIDTGAQGNSLEADLFDGLAHEQQIRIGASFRSITPTGALGGERGKLDGLSIGPFEHRGLRFSRLRYNSLGLRYFSRYVVTFDFPNECLYLRKGAHHSRSEPGATSGLSLTWENGAPVVQAVRADGPAARAGLARSDELVQIDGRRAAEFDHFLLRQLMTSEAGRRVKLRVRRGERLLDLVVVLAED